MFALNRWARILTCVAAFGMLASPVLGAAPIAGAKDTTKTVFDVKLSNGHLIGQVVKSSGKPEAGAKVTLTSKIAKVGELNADQLGRFSLPINKSGVYRVVVADRLFTVRAWQPEVAPPNAKTGLLCVTQDTVRGQCGGCGSLGGCSCGMAAPSCGVAGPACGAPCAPAGCGAGFGGGGGGLMSVLTNPVVIGLGIAAAIAIPIALDDDDDDNGGGVGNGGAGEPAS